MAAHSGRRTRAIAFAVGLAVTGLTVCGYALGLFTRAEQFFYDCHFRLPTAAGMPADRGDITLIDIDDSSLADYGRWPWPRQRLAEVVDELTDMGVRLIVLDVIMPEPQQPRPADNPFDKHFDLVGESPLLRTGSAGYVHDDRLLAEAIRRSGRVLLAMHFEEGLSPVFADAPPVGPIDPDDVLRRPARLIDAVVERVLATQPDADIAAVAAAVCPPCLHEAGPVQDAVFNSYRRVRSMRLLRAHATGCPSRSIAASSAGPIPQLAGACAGAGFVSFQADPDGCVRATPLLMSDGDRSWLQLGALAACRLMDVPADRIRLNGDELFLPRGELSPVRVPLDGQGRMLVNWHTDGERTWQETFRHVPIRSLLDIARNRRLIEENKLRLRLARQEAVRLAFGDESGELGEYLNGSELMDRPDRLADLPAAMRREVIERTDELVRLAQVELHRRLATTQPADDEHSRMLAWLADSSTSSAAVARENAALAAAIGSQRATLQPMIHGKVCLIGSTATGAADFLPTPPFARCPGVVVHANVLDTMLSGRFIQPAPGWANLLAIVFWGLVASAATCRFGPRLGTLLAFAAMVAAVGLNVLVIFGMLRYWTALAAPLTAVVLTWGFVTAYRQLTEERQRRWVTRVLGSYTSPAVARRIAEQPELLRLGGQRVEVSCFFSDLRGFTPLSERLGPERTVALLNRYLDRMTEVLLAHEATINKFSGDGIFAFFGAPEPQSDHAVRAARAAVACQRAMADLALGDGSNDGPGVTGGLSATGKPAGADTGGQAVRPTHKTTGHTARAIGRGEPLAMRIGIATGSAIVGNCGSTSKLDYTAIGDTVNLASRLESANKFFGTLILVSESAAAAMADEFVLRPMGPVSVVGRSQPEPVFELMGPRAGMAPADIAWAESFAEAVRLWAEKRIPEAAAAFERLSHARPTDRPTSLYLDLAFRAARSPAEWAGVIALAEK